METYWITGSTEHSNISKEEVLKEVSDAMDELTQKTAREKGKIKRWVLTKKSIDKMNTLRKKLGFEEGNYKEGQVLEVLIK